MASEMPHTADQDVVPIYKPSDGSTLEYWVRNQGSRVVAGNVHGKQVENGAVIQELDYPFKLQPGKEKYIGLTNTRSGTYTQVWYYTISNATYADAQSHSD